MPRRICAVVVPGRWHAKSEIVVAAREGDLRAIVQEAVAKLPDREYVDAADLTKALNASS